MVWLNDYKRMEIGSIVCIDAIDWAMYNTQSDPDEEYKLVRGLLYGEVVKYVSNGEGVLITPQRFEEGDIRCSLSIPLTAIKSVRVLATRGEMQRGQYDPVAEPSQR